ncbi:MAG: hypothetical protein ACK4VY_01030 [Brevundimonas sp.]
MTHCSPLDAYDEAPTVRLLDGEVVLCGVVDAAFTPAAAMELAHRLLRVAAANSAVQRA